MTQARYADTSKSRDACTFHTSTLSCQQGGPVRENKVKHMHQHCDMHAYIPCKIPSHMQSKREEKEKDGEREEGVGERASKHTTGVHNIMRTT